MPGRCRQGDRHPHLPAHGRTYSRAAAGVRQAIIPAGFAERLRSALDEVKDRENARLRFIGYTGNERLDRRTASVYEDDIGLSAARASRAMETIRSEMQLSPEQVEHEGHGFVQSADLPNEGFTQGADSYIEVQVVYDEPAVRDDYEGVDITRLNRELAPANAFGLNPMHISVDGKPIDDPDRSSADVQRCTDVALDQAGIRFQFDDLNAEPRLSVSASPQVPVDPSGMGDGSPCASACTRTTGTSSTAPKCASSRRTVDRRPRHWPSWRWSQRRCRVAAGMPSIQASARVAVPAARIRRAGPFDETSLRPLWLVNAGAASAGDQLCDRQRLFFFFFLADRHRTASRPERTTSFERWRGRSFPRRRHADRRRLLAGYGESRLAVQTSSSAAAPSRCAAAAFRPSTRCGWPGRPVPVDANGNFIAEEILPEGLHTVEVAVLDQEGNGALYLRDLELSSSDRFYVGIADLTVAKNRTSGPADLLQGENTRLRPRLVVRRPAGLLRHREVRRYWRLTASADTREGPVKDLFSNFLDKSPDSLFRRIDPDYHYPDLRR